MDKGEAFCTDGETVDERVTMEVSMEVPPKAEDRSSTLRSYSACGYLPRGLHGQTSQQSLLQCCSWELSYGTSLIVSDRGNVMHT